jgi:hypothetical protein
MGFGYLTTSSNDYTTALGPNATASSQYSTAIGGNSAFSGSQTVTGAGAMALGGSYASGTDSFAAAIANNTSTYGATAANTIAMGYRGKASGQYASAVGGNTSTASGIGSAAIGGNSNAASGAYAVVLGGDANSASAESSYAFGVRSSATVINKYVFGAATNSGFVVGGSQYGVLVLGTQTTDATATVLRSNTNAAGTTNQLILQNNQAMVETGSVICRQSVAGSDKASGWTFLAVIRQGANAGTTALVAAVTPVLVAQDVSLATTALAVTADTTNGGLAVTVTGIAATNLRWVATLNTAEVIYA